MRKGRPRKKLGDSITLTLPSFLPGWPIAVQFVGKGEGQERVWWYTGQQIERLPARGPLGMALHAVLVGGRPPRFPDWNPGTAREFRASIQPLVAAWPWRTRASDVPAVPTLLESIFLAMMNHISPDAIQLSPMVGIAGYSPAELAKLQSTAVRINQSARKVDLLYHATHTKLATAWRVRDLVSVVWAELLHAWDQHAMLEQCRGAGSKEHKTGWGCGALFLRPRGVIGRLCPTCRDLTWRQHRGIHEAPPQDRLVLAVRLAGWSA